MKNRGWIEQYKRSTITGVQYAYGRCSQAKINAEIAILQEMFALGGHGYRILSATCNFFTCAYRLGQDLVVHTYMNRYLVPWED